MPYAKSSFCRFASKGTEELFVTLDRKLIGSWGWGGGGVKKIYIRAREINLEKNSFTRSNTNKYLCTVVKKAKHERGM